MNRTLRIGLALLILAGLARGADSPGCHLESTAKIPQGYCVVTGPACSNGPTCVLQGFNPGENSFTSCGCKTLAHGAGFVRPPEAGGVSMLVVAPQGQQVQAVIFDAPGGNPLEIVGDLIAAPGINEMFLTRPLVDGEFLAVVNLVDGLRTATIRIETIAAVPVGSTGGLALLLLLFAAGGIALLRRVG